MLSSTFVSIKGFSLSLAYRASLHNLETHSHVNISWLWRSQTLPKVKYFLWLVWLGRFPHNLLLSIRIIVPSPKYMCCDFPCENDDHVLRNGNVAAQIRSTLTPNLNHDAPLEERLSKNLSNTSMVDGI